MNEIWLQQIDRRLDRIERLLNRALNGSDEVLSVAEAAERLGLSVWTIRRAIANKELAAKRPGGRKYRIKVLDLIRWDSERGRKPGRDLKARISSRTL